MMHDSFSPLARSQSYLFAGAANSVGDLIKKSFYFPPSKKKRFVKMFS